MEQQPKMEKCPVCGETHEIPIFTGIRNYKQFNCKTPSLIDESVLEIYPPNETELNHRLNVIANFLLINPKSSTRYYWRFYFEPSEEESIKEHFINIFQLMKTYPDTVEAKIEKILLNAKRFAKNSSVNIGELGSNSPRLLYPDNRDFYVNTAQMTKFFQQRGYADDKGFLTVDGWKQIDKIFQDISENNIFIATQFDGFKEEILAMKSTIQDLKITPRCMDDLQTNQYIMPEIFHQIKHSRAVVAEISSGNQGVYYEIGYALGQGKPIILLCKQEIFNDLARRPHFDIAQVSMILYKDLNELSAKLKNRLIATLDLKSQ